MADKEEVEEDLQKLDEKNIQVEEKINKLKEKLLGVGGSNQEIEDRINELYDRQKEVMIGKRNVNCLSCSKEPGYGQIQGSDGKIYKGSPPRTNEKTERKVEENQQDKPKKLLAMKWDHIGLQQQSFSQTFELGKAGAKTERPNIQVDSFDQEEYL